VISDCGDAPSGGSAGDNPTVLKKLLDLGLDKSDKNIYLTLVDPRAAKAASNSGVGKDLELRLGHYFSINDGKPLKIKAKVKTITDGSFTIKHGLEGVEMQFGLTALIMIGSISIAVRSYGGLEWDVGQYTSVGLDLKDASIVFVKSPSHFREAYDYYADQILIADTPGATRCNIQKVEYKNMNHPIFPLNNI
jgi:microcystin degradation protein MlrC